MAVDEGEAWGVLEAIKLVVELGLEKVVVETDAKRVSDAYASRAADISTFGDYVAAGKVIF